ncbi:MAG: hypothetical protein JWM11_3681 [Planctomycetaceae bacterium]|nr:hypothetical protein [Planctomycetaceae bacterium]
MKPSSIAANIGIVLGPSKTLLEVGDADRKSRQVHRNDLKQWHVFRVLEVNSSATPPHKTTIHHFPSEFPSPPETNPSPAQNSGNTANL